MNGRGKEPTTKMTDFASRPTCLTHTDPHSGLFKLELRPNGRGHDQWVGSQQLPMLPPPVPKAPSWICDNPDLIIEKSRICDKFRGSPYEFGSIRGSTHMHFISSKLTEFQKFYTNFDTFDL